MTRSLISGQILSGPPAHGPRGPPLKSKNPADTGQPGAFQGTADAIGTPMEA